MATRNIKLTIAYDGSGYHGWQAQPMQTTIQGILTDALFALTSQQISTKGASRTDAGVSALGQQVLFTIDSPIPTENFQKALNDRLPKNIAVTEAAEVPDDFDVISDVTSKLYRYTISTAKTRPVLSIDHAWHLPYKLDQLAMDSAAKLLVGTHDFKSFASAADNRTNSVRTIFGCNVIGENELIHIDTEGSGFLYNMVRNIVGTLVEIGIGRWKPQIINHILAAKDRTAAGPIAPPQGLCLMWIKY